MATAAARWRDALQFLAVAGKPVLIHASPVVSAKNRAISVSGYAGLRVAIEGLSSPRCRRRSTVIGFFQPHACAVSVRVRAMRPGNCWRSKSRICAAASTIAVGALVFAECIFTPLTITQAAGMSRCRLG